MNRYYAIIISLLVIAGGCQNSRQNSRSEASVSTKQNNPAAKGFNAHSSDARAVAIADSVMQAMGGRQSWDQTKVIHWTFLGRRSHWWNKHTGMDRIEFPDKNITIIENMNSKKGAVMKNGKRLRQPDSVQAYLKKGYQWWVNDSYWLVMPYKLKDSGVTLKYKGVDKIQTGEPAYKLQLTFDSVGVTPQNKFYVFVDTADYMVRQWAYFPRASMDTAAFVLPWKDYKKYGQIMLSGNRGKYKLTNISVMDHMPSGSDR